MSLIEAQGRVRAEGVLVARRSWLHSLELEFRVAMVGGCVEVRWEYGYCFGCGEKLLQFLMTLLVR